MMCVVGNNVEHFSALCAKSQKHGKMFGVVATTQKNCHNAEQYNIFLSLSLLLKGQRA
jgi:hypothetical protein